MRYTRKVAGFSDTMPRLSGMFNIQRGALGMSVNNLITTIGRDSLVNSVLTDEGPAWLYVGIGVGTATPGSSDTALGDEIHRELISARWSPSSGQVKLLSVIGPYYGNGHWREIGIFDTPEVRSILSSCEGTAYWTSDGTLTSEATMVQEGLKSLRAQMLTGDLIPFGLNTNDAADLGFENQTFGTADIFQFLYRTSADTGALTVRVGMSSASYFQWTWDPGTVDAWALFSQTFASATQVGTPSYQLNYFRLSHSSVAATYYEYLDRLSVFQKDGSLMVHAALDFQKDWNEVINAYYILRF